MAGELVPFGKYKGQPVEVLRGDPKYLDWVMSQDWVRQRYEATFNFIINNFGEPAETPEHNALQVLFLDQGFSDRFYDHLAPGRRKEWATKWAKHELDDVQKRLRYAEGYDKEAVPGLRDEEVERHEIWAGGGTVDSVNIAFEDKGADVVLNGARIEIKPTVGDNFPAVLRQMKANKCDVLYVGSYSGMGATREQFVAFFKREGIRVVFHGDVEIISNKGD